MTPLSICGFGFSLSESPAVAVGSFGKRIDLIS